MINVYHLDTENLDLEYYDNLHAMEDGTEGHSKATEFIINYRKK